jgi:hypothetical protein
MGPVAFGLDILLNRQVNTDVNAHARVVFVVKVDITVPFTTPYDSPTS